MTSSGFRNWKKSLRQVRTIGESRESMGEKVFYEVHHFKENIDLAYLYRRERYQASPDTLYFFDISAANPRPSQFPELETRNKIEYVVWKFDRSSRGLVITVQGKINHTNFKPGTLSLSLTDQFLGDVDRLCSGSSYTLPEDASFKINSAFFQDLYLSQFMNEAFNEN